MRLSIGLLTCAFALWGGSAAGLHWTDPIGWKNEGSKPMRAVTYSVPPSAGDNESSECVVYFFGAGSGGSIEANMERWKAQVRKPAGTPADAKEGKRTIHGLNVTTLDTSGDYSGMGGPMAAEKTVKANYRLLGAIVEGPGGNLFIKFAGPQKTVAANQKKFETLLTSLQKQ
jgi:hypothetical protein